MYQSSGGPSGRSEDEGENSPPPRAAFWFVLLYSFVALAILVITGLVF